MWKNIGDFLSVQEKSLFVFKYQLLKRVFFGHFSKNKAFAIRNLRKPVWSFRMLVIDLYVKNSES
jgi:hypothetical protein